MSRLYVCLGRLGDICNFLPLLDLEFQRGNKCGILVAKEFSAVLDGVSYVDAYVYDGLYHEVGKACAMAEGLRPGNWTCVQINCSNEAVTQFVYGPAGQKTAVTSSFQKESWRVCGHLQDWDNQPPLRFDRRDIKRESQLLHDFGPGPKQKLVLYSLAGVTSPFPLATVVKVMLTSNFSASKWKLVDLSTIKAERFYDLLGLYEKAHCLIATDSAPLHLARAVPKLPVLALANDKPLLWNGSSWRPNHTFYCRYSDFAERAAHFVWALDQIGGVGFRGTTHAPHIYHLWSEYEGVSRWPSWFDEYETGRWAMNPIEVGACGRDSTINLKDPKRLPFLRDCLRMAMQRARDNDLICLTRPDTRFVKGLTGELIQHSPAFAYRMNRKAGQDTFQPVADLFCATKSLWAKLLPDIPDFILGRDVFFAHGLWALFNKNEATDLTGWIYRDVH